MSNPQAMLFDPARAARCHTRAAQNFAAHDFLFARAERDILERLTLINRRFENILLIGARATPVMRQALDTMNATYHVVDIPTPFLQTWQNHLDLPASEILPIEAQSYDLVLSTLSLQTFNDLPGLLTQIRLSLRPDGVFLGALLGGETLYQLRSVLTQTEMMLHSGASPRISPMIDKPQMGSLMQRAGFALPVIDSDIISAHYQSLPALIKDLRGMGEGLTLSKRNTRYLGRTFWAQASALYAAQFADADGLLRASFEIIHMQGWAPHNSQQKPLKPGSATQRLADALHTQEISAGSPVDRQE